MKESTYMYPTRAFEERWRFIKSVLFVYYCLIISDKMLKFSGFICDPIAVVSRNSDDAKREMTCSNFSRVLSNFLMTLLEQRSIFSITISVIDGGYGWDFTTKIPIRGNWRQLEALKDNRCRLFWMNETRSCVQEYDNMNNFLHIRKCTWYRY